jgi:23S rRNA pseudouridine2605 synthase
MIPADARVTAGERVQKFLARAGVGSRRACEQLVVQGRVRVNGDTVTELGARVFPGSDTVTVDGAPVRPQKFLHLVFHKPKNCLCTSRDDRGRKTVLDLLPGISQRIYTVGRLDYDAEGVLILTNDGDFAHRVIHPSFRIPRTYRVTVKGLFTHAAEEELRRGVKLEGRLVRPLDFRVISRLKRGSRLEIEIAEGINRQVKRMLACVGYEVTAIQRIRIGGVRLGALAPGKFRRMTQRELRSFEQLGASKD